MHLFPKAVFSSQMRFAVHIKVEMQHPELLLVHTVEFLDTFMMLQMTVLSKHQSNGLITPGHIAKSDMMIQFSTPSILTGFVHPPASLP